MIDLARSLLGELLGGLHETATGDLKDYDHLHQVRIAGKRLRYALEVFADCFSPALCAGCYPMVEEMQEILGRANDSHVAGQRLVGLRVRLRGWDSVWERLKPGLEGLLRFHQRRLPQERRRFLKWWEQWCSAGVEAVLAEPVCRCRSENGSARVNLEAAHMRVRTLALYLIGDRQAILDIAADRHALWVGFLWCCRPASPESMTVRTCWASRGTCSFPWGALLAASFLLFLVVCGRLFLRSEGRPPFFAAYRSFLTLFWMTAPLAWLYAIPYERFLSPARRLRRISGHSRW